MPPPPLCVGDENGGATQHNQGNALAGQLLRRELGCGWDSLTVCRGCALREAASLEERIPAPAACKHVDKAFCAAWGDSRTVLVGTKCGSLLSVDAGTGAWRRLFLLPPDAPPSFATAGAPPPAAAAAAPSSAAAAAPPGCRAQGIHAVAFAPSPYGCCSSSDQHDQLVATAGAGPGRAADVAILCRSAAAAAADGPGAADAAASSAAFAPLPPLVGHADAVFGAAWLSPRDLLTASRDGTVKAWCVEDEHEARVKDGGRRRQLPLQPCAATSDAHGGGGGGGGMSASAPRPPLLPRVRDVRPTGEPGCAVSVASDGGLAVWDTRAGAGGLRLAAPLLRVPRLLAAGSAATAAAPSAATPVSAAALQTPEIVNLAASGPVVAIASRLGATLVDLRSGRECWHVTPGPLAVGAATSRGGGGGGSGAAWARSVCLRSPRGGHAHASALPELLSVGTADGRLLLYDLRAPVGGGAAALGLRALPSFASSPPGPPPPQQPPLGPPSLSRLLASHALSDGHLDRDHPIYRERFAPRSFPAAAQAHAWEPPSFSSSSSGVGGAAVAAPRVFVGGGPLPSGVRGCYLGVWL